jgi:hypothetical protein
MNVCDASSSAKDNKDHVQCLTVLESACFSRKEKAVCIHTGNKQKQGKSYLFRFHYIAVLFITPPHY